MVDEIKEKFTGTWKMDRSEHFDDFLSAMGETYMINLYFAGKKACLLKWRYSCLRASEATSSIRFHNLDFCLLCFVL